MWSFYSTILNWFICELKLGYCDLFDLFTDHRPYIITHVYLMFLCPMLFQYFLWFSQETTMITEYISLFFPNITFLVFEISNLVHILNDFFFEGCRIFYPIQELPGKLISMKQKKWFSCPSFSFKVKQAVNSPAVEAVRSSVYNAASLCKHCVHSLWCTACSEQGELCGVCYALWEKQSLFLIYHT